MPSFSLYTHRLAGAIAAAAVCFMIFASGASAASVTLAWDQPDSSAVQGYHIYYGPSDEGSAYKEKDPKTIDSADQTQYVIEELEPGVEYLFAATSHDGNGNQSDFSEEIAYEVPVSISTHDVALAVSGSEGGWILHPNGECTSGCIIAFDSGSSAEFSFQSNTGYEVSDVMVDDASIGAVATYTLDNISEDHSITASFDRIRHTVSAAAGDGGTIDPAGDMTVEYGDSVNIVVSASEGYSVSDVVVNGESQGPVSEFTIHDITADQRVTASFSENAYSIAATTGSGGSISPAGDVFVTHGDSLRFDITPNDGYETDDVRVNGQSVGAVDAYTFDSVTGDAEIHAAFTAIQYTVNATAGSGGSIDPGGELAASYGESMSFSITPDDGYAIDDVQVNGQSVGAVSGYTFDAVEADATIHAVFAATEEEEEETDEEESDPSQDPAEETGLPPHEPELLDPEDFIVVEYGDPITLMADVYSHPEGSVHYLSHWQIRRVDMKKPVYEITSEVDRLIHDVSEDLEEGLKYAWRVGFQDIESGQIAWSEERTFVVGEKTLQNSAPPVEAGRSINDYEMVSFGHWSGNACSKEVFGSLMDPNHKNNDYRILAYDSNSDWRPNPSWDGGYRDYGDFEVVPGRAYWVLARHGMDLDRQGVATATTEDIFVELDYNPSNDDGWTMIAVPNNAEYHWGNVEIVVHDDEGNILYGPMPIRQLAEDNPYIDTRLWEWERPDSRYEVRDSANFRIQPHGGYWAKARAENVSLNFPYDMQIAWANPKVMMNGWFHAGIEWMDENILPRPAYANLDADGQESPPMPAAGLEETHDPVSDEDPSDDGSGNGGEPGCFIRSIAGGKTNR